LSVDHRASQWKSSCYRRWASPHPLRKWAFLSSVGLLLHLPAAAQDVGVSSGSALITGVVVAGDSNAAIPAASVELVTMYGVTVASAVTDDAGRFKMPRIGEGKFRVHLSSLGYSSASTVPFQVAQAEERDLGYLRMFVDAV